MMDKLKESPVGNKPAIWGRHSSVYEKVSGLFHIFTLSILERLPHMVNLLPVGQQAAMEKGIDQDYKWRLELSML